MYLRWLGILDKQGQYIYATSSQEKIVMFQDTSKDNFLEEKAAPGSTIRKITELNMFCFDLKIE